MYRASFPTFVVLAAVILCSLLFSSTWLYREQMFSASAPQAATEQRLEDTKQTDTTQSIPWDEPPSSSYAHASPEHDPESSSPHSTAVETAHHATHVPEPKWLIATMVAAHSIGRRAIIRSTWQTLYKDPELFSTRFVISNPGPQWEDIIAQENATFGDIIMMRHLEESASVANHVKTIEFLKWVVEQGYPWRYVSKIDDDSYLEPFAFWRNYLEPLYATSATRTIVARYLNWPLGNFKFPGGQFYTLTWDMVELVTSLYKKNPMEDEFEDVLVGRLLEEAGEPWELIVLENPVAFDYDDGFGREIDGVKTAWYGSGNDPNAWVHGVGPGAINPHKMKTDESYMRVAACYGPDGLLPMPEYVEE